MSDASGSAVIVFNGEIYNFPGLRTQLEAEGPQAPVHKNAVPASWSFFFYLYFIIRMGILDGRVGFDWCIHKAVIEWMITMKTGEAAQV